MAVEVVLYHYGAGYQWGVYRRVRIRHREKRKAHTGMNQVSTGDREKKKTRVDRKGRNTKKVGGGNDNWKRETDGVR